MAGDWVKMKSGIRRNPKVVAMARFLSRQADFTEWMGIASRDSSRDSSRDAVTCRVVSCVTVASLLEVWGSLNDSLRSDGVAAYMTLEDIDEIPGVPKFGEAMELVGWVVVQDDGSLLFPNFCENNTPAKERATPKSDSERSKAYRERKKSAKKASEERVTNDTSRHAEKRREDISNNKEGSERDEHFPEVKIPSLKEVTEYGSIHGKGPNECQAMFDYYQGNNKWMNEHGKARDWKYLLTSKAWESRQPRQPKASRVRERLESRRPAATSKSGF